MLYNLYYKLHIINIVLVIFYTAEVGSSKDLLLHSVNISFILHLASDMFQFLLHDAQAFFQLNILVHLNELLNSVHSSEFNGSKLPFTYLLYHG